MQKPNGNALKRTKIDNLNIHKHLIIETNALAVQEVTHWQNTKI